VNEVSNEKVGEVSGLLLGYSHSMPNHIAALMRQAAAMLDYFKAARIGRQVLYVDPEELRRALESPSYPNLIASAQPWQKRTLPLAVQDNKSA
jgi:hypothetical protein